MQGYSVGDTVNNISVCRLLVSGDGEEGGYAAGSWGGQMWGVELFGGLYGAKAELDLTKTQASWVNNRQKNLQQLHI